MPELNVDVTISSGNFVFINQLSDFPDAVAGVRTLLANTTYFICGHIDLLGDRIVCSDNTTILGASSEDCSLTSTGIATSFPTNYMIEMDYTVPIRHITLKDVPLCIGVNLSDTADQPIALDWTGVNFSGCDTNMYCNTIDNWIFSKGAILGSGTFVFNSSVGTIGVDNSLFVGSGSAYNMIDLTSNCIVTRRFRIIYSSVVAFGGTTGINVDTSATIPNEGYILDNINFSGGSTYLTGVAPSDNKARFVGCRGIDNSSNIGHYYMVSNATVTSIPLQSTFYKILGATSDGSFVEKFDVTTTDNKAVYTGSLVGFYKVHVVVSATTGGNRELELAIYKNGVISTQSRAKGTTRSNGKAQNFSCQDILQLNENDYIEVYIANNTASQDITVEDLNVVVTRLN